MSTDSHSAMAAEIARYRKALRAIADLEGDEPGSGLMAARLASAALASGESEPAMPAEPHPLLCGARNGPSICNRVAGHAGGFNSAGHSDGRRSW